MSADVATQPLSKVDSLVDGKTDTAIDDTPASPTESKIKHRRTSSTVSGVFNINDLEKQNVDLQIAPETQKLNWKINTSPSSIEDKDMLKKMLTEPPIKKIDLVFPLGLEVTARNLRGVTIKDAMDAIYKQFKKKADDELTDPYLKGFEWDREECYTRFIVHQMKQGTSSSNESSKKKKKNKNEDGA